MREALDIAREHGQGPSWWSELARGEQALLLADRRLRNEERIRAAHEHERRAAAARRRR